MYIKALVRHNDGVDRKVIIKVDTIDYYNDGQTPCMVIKNEKSELVIPISDNVYTILVDYITSDSIYEIGGIVGLLAPYDKHRAETLHELYTYNTDMVESTDKEMGIKRV